MSRLSEAFRNGKAFIPFITCGDPNLSTTGEIIREAVENGADIIELGIPFSDPTAEGPAIQAANIRALSTGITTDAIFNFVREIRKEVSIPMVFMTYANVVFSYGSERFISICSEIGIDGLILPDVPYEEKEDFEPLCTKYGLDFISMVAPTSEDRIGMIAKEAKGFIYIVSSLGVTGVRNSITADIEGIVKHIKKFTSVPCAVGFGISTEEQAETMASKADGVIVGSAIVKLAAEYKEDSPKIIGDYVGKMKRAAAKSNIPNFGQ